MFEPGFENNKHTKKYVFEIHTYNFYTKILSHWYYLKYGPQGLILNFAVSVDQERSSDFQWLASFWSIRLQLLSPRLPLMLILYLFRLPLTLRRYQQTWQLHAQKNAGRPAPNGYDHHNANFVKFYYVTSNASSWPSSVLRELSGTTSALKQTSLI